MVSKAGEGSPIRDITVRTEPVSRLLQPMWFFPAVHIQPPASQTGIPNPATSSFPNMAPCDPARVEAALLFNPSEEGEAATAEICLSAINESVPRICMCPGPFEQAKLIQALLLLP